MGRWSTARRVALLTGMLAAFAAVPAAAQDAVKIGYAISLTGPQAEAAGITTLANYRLWVKDVNAAGGILLSGIGKRVPIEVVEYDDRGDADEAIKAVERLAKEDKVDFILPPSGTGLNLAIGPTLHRAGYPHLAVAAHTERAPELAKIWPNASFWLGVPSDVSAALVDLLAEMRRDGRIGPRIAMVSVADPFGEALSGAARDALTEGSFKLVFDKTFATGTRDIQPIIEEAKASNADVFIAFTHPPDTLAFATTARVLEFNPKVFFVGLGAALPAFKQRLGAKAEGVMGIGGWHAGSPQLKDYVERHARAIGREPDRWAGPVTYASLQALQQAIERVGKIDRAAVGTELRAGTFDTAIGKVKLQDGLLKDHWVVGQWQGGEFAGIAPTAKAGARPPLSPKPAW